MSYVVTRKSMVLMKKLPVLMNDWFWFFLVMFFLGAFFLQPLTPAKKTWITTPEMITGHRESKDKEDVRKNVPREDHPREAESGQEVESKIALLDQFESEMLFDSEDKIEQESEDEYMEGADNPAGLREKGDNGFPGNFNQGHSNNIDMGGDPVRRGSLESGDETKLKDTTGPEEETGSFPPRAKAPLNKISNSLGNIGFGGDLSAEQGDGVGVDKTGIDILLQDLEATEEDKLIVLQDDTAEQGDGIDKTGIDIFLQDLESIKEDKLIAWQDDTAAMPDEYNGSPVSGQTDTGNGAVLPGAPTGSVPPLSGQTYSDNGSFEELFGSWLSRGENLPVSAQQLSLFITNSGTADDLSLPLIGFHDNKFVDILAGQIISAGAPQVSGEGFILFQSSNPLQERINSITGQGDGADYEIRYFLDAENWQAFYGRAYRAFSWSVEQGLIPEGTTMDDIQVSGGVYVISHADGRSFIDFVPNSISVKGGEAFNVRLDCFSGQADIGFLTRTGAL